MSSAPVLRRLGRRLTPSAVRRAVAAAPPAEAPAPAVPAVPIGPDDPLLPLLLSATGAVDIGTVDLDSPALTAMRAQDVVLAVPLVTSGELVGVLTLGPRLSERQYSSTDKQLLDTLAGYAAPAIRVGQLVQRQAGEARERERIEHELGVAQLIQQQFLPQTLPDLAGWQLAASYRPAGSVGGDFYDFLTLPDGRLLVVVGDVTDKGVPAALVMSSTLSLLRAAARRLPSPGAVLADVNDMLCDEIPAHMFVTCALLALDPADGSVEFANAGHPLPFLRRTPGGPGPALVEELRARGMPLGLMPGMAYEHSRATMAVGDSLLLHSDGLAEAHDAGRAMFGFPRLAGLVARDVSGPGLIDLCLAELAAFTGGGLAQEDDITLVTLERRAMAEQVRPSDVLDSFALPSVPGGEREALRRVSAVASAHGVAGERLRRLETAVAETTMNAIEHGNGNDATLLVDVRVLRVDGGLAVEVDDDAVTGGHVPRPGGDPVPDLDLKLSGLQSPRGWGLFLVQAMVDSVSESTVRGRHTVRLVLRDAVEAGDGEDAPRGRDRQDGP